jgi:hypothetical protein
MATNAGTTQMMADVATNLQTVGRKIPTYQAFLAATGQKNTIYFDQYSEINNSYNAMNLQFGGREQSAKSLVLKKVLKDLSDVFHFRADLEVFFSSVISVLPDILSVLFALILIIWRSAALGTSEIENETERLNAQTQALKATEIALAEHQKVFSRVMQSRIVMSVRAGLDKLTRRA